MIDRLRAAWPARPLTLNPPIAAWRGWLLVGILIAIAAAIFALIAHGLAGQIIDDLQMSDRARPVQTARIENGRCTSRIGLLHLCDMTVVATTKDGLVRRDITHAFVDFHIGDWTAQVMADPARPGVFTTNIGLDKLYSRIATVVGLGALGVFMLIWPLGHLRRSAAERKRLAALSARPLTPVPLAVQAWKGNLVTLVDAQGATHSWTVPPNRPLFGLGDGHVLGVAGPSGQAFPLDEKLRWIKLTEHERAALKQARPA